jgi:2-keto-4-pentenoate hydratase
VARRVAAGEKVIGKKIGATSKPVQDFLGVYQPDFGILLSGMVYTEGPTPSTSAGSSSPRPRPSWPSCSRRT